MAALKLYPVGIQTFEEIVKRDLLYIDKTEITIKGYDPDTELYQLDIPNKEIRVGLYRCLLPLKIGR